MIGTIVIAAAAAVDGLATGVWIGKKWGTKVTTAALTAAGATLKTDVTKVETAVAPTVTIAEADLKALLAHFETAVPTAKPGSSPAPAPLQPAPVATPDANIQALLKQLAATSTAPGAPVAK